MIDPVEAADARDAADDSMPDPWKVRHFDPDVGGPDFARLLTAFRELQDRFVAALPPLDEMIPMAARVEALAAEFAAWEGTEFHVPSGMRNDLPGRGSAMMLPIIFDDIADERVSGRVTFRRFHLGGNGAAHGGTLPLMFDDVLGRLVNTAGRSVARTAYLTVNYRRITRIGRELRFDATMDRIEGRKRWASGRLWDGDDLVSDADGLFIELRPGQP